MDNHIRRSIMEYSDYKKEIEAMSAKISDFRGSL